MLARLAALGALLLLSACATMSPEERANTCRATDWQRFGLNDGKLGVPVSARTEAFQACAEVGQPVDLVAYEAGRAEGLKSYCTAENGFTVGYEGRRYARVCPPELEPDFVQGFRRGRNERPYYPYYYGFYGGYPQFGIGIGDYWGYPYPGFYRPPYWCGYRYPGCF